MDEFVSLDATAQAELVRKKQVEPIELVEAAIRRIEAVNPKINAVVTTLFDEGRKAASGPLPPGPFSGVPFLLKDLLASYAGVRMTSGSRFLRDYLPAVDSELVVRLKKAGLIIIGKTNTPEFGLLPTTEPTFLGPTRNPWDTNRTAGGSSGGSAAAVAAGMVPMAHGGDGGGSIRIPASYCGLFGLKPTRGRTTFAPQFGDIFSGLVVEHAITRSVRDSALLLDAIAGPGIGDPYWVPPPHKSFLEKTKTPPRRLRIAFTTKTMTGVPVHPDCVFAAQEAAKLCSGLGHEVTEKDIRIDGEQLVHVLSTMFLCGAAWAVADASRLIGRTPSKDDLETLTQAMNEFALHKTGADHLMAVQDLQKLSREIVGHFTGYDLWLTPTMPEPPFPLGSLDPQPDNPLYAFFRSAEIIPFTIPFNATGQPAMSVPLFWNKEGLPIGVQFIGHYGEEATLFRLAAQLESARPWADRRPNL
jgi:amidase